MVSDPSELASKGAGKFRRPATRLISVDDAVVEPAPATVKNATSKMRQLAANTFSSNLDRANSSLKEDRKKPGADSHGASRSQVGKGAQAPSSANKNKQAPNTSRFGIRSSQELKREGSAEDPRRSAQGTGVSNF